jgi:hypothetical protein
LKEELGVGDIECRVTICLGEEVDAVAVGIGDEIDTVSPVVGCGEVGETRTLVKVSQTTQAWWHCSSPYLPSLLENTLKIHPVMKTVTFNLSLIVLVLKTVAKILITRYYKTFF